MVLENLWGELPDVSAWRTPAAILREQAAQLADLTAHVVSARVESGTTRDNKFVHSLNVVAPALNDYTLTIATVWHEISLYPLRMKPFFDNQYLDCYEEKEFIATLKTILSSPKVISAIGSLIAQSKDKQENQIIV